MTGGSPRHPAHTGSDRRLCTGLWMGARREQMVGLGSKRTGTKDAAKAGGRWHGTVLPRAALAVAGLLALLLTACSPQQGGPGGLAKSQVFVWPYNGQSKITYDEVLDPAIITYAVDQSTASMIYTSLITYDSGL